MPGNDVASSTEAASTGTISVLERFRQLSREKEQQQSVGSSGSQAPVTAVFLNNGIEKSDDMQKVPQRESPWEQERRYERGDKRTYDTWQHNSDSKKKKFIHQGLMEKDVGITEYVNSNIIGFHGIIKQRYTDFQVHEIDTDGNLVKLTSTELPPEPPEKELTDEHSRTLSDEDWKKLVEIYENKTEGNIFSIDVTEMEKTKRSQIHTDVKRRFGVNMYSNTVDKDGRKIIQIGYTPKNKDRKSWPLNLGKFLYFVVHKENAETAETIHMLCHKLRMKPGLFSYAGTKDKRAVTSQLMSVRKTLAKRLVALGNMYGVKVGNFVYKNKSLRLGQLKGNHFTVALRCVDADDEVIQKAVSSLKECGFVNYFGHQRFGSSQIVPTHLVGKAILQDDYKQAVELILKPRPGERSYFDAERAREIWWETRDARRAVKCFRRSDRSIESRILFALSKLGSNAYVNALEALPRNSVMLYLHSYQSLMWNKVVSRRIKKYGLKPLPGDLVLEDPDGGDNDTLKTDDVPVESDDSAGEDNEDEGQLNKAKSDNNSDTKSVRKLNENEADNITIEKVVYPLLGYDVEFPNNEIASWYVELLKEDGVTTDMFKKKNKLFSISGSYRNIIAKPWDVQWQTKQYSEQNADLILTDADQMAGRPPIESIPDGQYKALIIDFSLKPSVYATMALRELLKCETSTTHQANLTEQHNTAVEQMKKEQQTATKKTEETVDANDCKLNEDKTD